MTNVAATKVQSQQVKKLRIIDTATPFLEKSYFVILKIFKIVWLAFQSFFPPWVCLFIFLTLAEMSSYWVTILLSQLKSICFGIRIGTHPKNLKISIKRSGKLWLLFTMDLLFIVRSSCLWAQPLKAKILQVWWNNYAEMTVYTRQPNIG